MKTLVVYGTTYGYAQDCAHTLAALLPGPVEVVDAASAMMLPIRAFDRIIIGSSVYMGKPQKSVVTFCTQRQQELMEKQLGLYLCCALPEGFDAAISLAFPQPLRQSAVAVANFGGRLDTAKMSFMHRTITHLILRAATPEAGPVQERPEALRNLAQRLLN